MMPGTTLQKCTTTYALAEAIANRCEDPEPDGDGFRARCPNHQGKSATSLSITPTEDRVLVKCFAECPQQAVVHALGLTMQDLFLASSARRNGTERIVHLYDYYDAQGTLVHQTVRFEPKKFRQRRPDPVVTGHFLWNLKTIETVLYHLPDVLRAVATQELIYLVEGEKDADALQDKGYVATCNPMGAKKWRDSYTETLRGAHVVILADYDQAGWDHANVVAKALFGHAADIKVIHAFHTDVSGSDISDWLAEEHTRAEFESIVDSTPLL